MENAQGAPPDPIRLLILGDGSVRTLPLHGTRWVIGRSSDCDVQLRDLTVSRKHLLIERHGDEFRFQELSGSNPVMLDGRPRKQGVVRIGQTLSEGGNCLRRTAPAVTPFANLITDTSAQT